MRRQRVAAIACVLAACGGALPGQTTPNSAPADFGAKYTLLKPEQRSLIDDWVRRFSATIQKQVDPEKAYDNLPLSLKTTFNAVTHALLSTELTDASGAKLGAAFQIVDKLHTVRGEVPDARGDEQFRIYVELKPTAIDILEKSQEFQRTADNSVYHRGYPICYRSKPAAPSIQVSATRDKTRADIDVDYRSSGFPKALVNGHLAASNSDVRAGRNDETHNNRWRGLNNWWRSLLSLPQAGEKLSAGVEESGRIAAAPAAREGMKPADAVFDLLNTWLVKGDVENVLSYFSEQSYACGDLERGEKSDYGMAKFRLLMALRQAHQRFGKAEKLADISTAAPLERTGVRSKLVQQPYRAQFALYDVREDAAERFKCANRLDPTQKSPKAAASDSFGKYYGAIFRLGGKIEARPTTLATLWTREGKGWKLISYDIDPVWDEAPVPDTATAAPAGEPAEYVTAPAELVTAGTMFLETWLVKQNVESAMASLSARCIDCVKLNLSAGEPAPASTENARAQLKEAMRRIIETAGVVKKLDQAIVAPQANHADIKPVRHGNSKAFAIASIPDDMASALDCKSRSPGEPVRFQPPAGGRKWGSHYAIGIRLAKAGEDSGVLWTVWGRESAAWKMVAYTVLTP